MPNHSKPLNSDSDTPAAHTVQESTPRNKLALWLSVTGIVASVFAIAAILFAIHYYAQNRDARNAADERASAEAASCVNAKAWTTFDYTGFDAWRATVLGGTTGKWHDQFDSSSNTVKNLYIQGKFSSSATELHCGVESVDGDHAKVVVGIEQTVKSLVTPAAGNTTRFFVISDLDKVDGRWLVSDVEAPSLMARAPTAAEPTAPR